MGNNVSVAGSARSGILPGAALAFALVFLAPSFLYGGGAAPAGLPFGNFVLFALTATLVIAAMLAAVAALFKNRALPKIFLAIAIAIALKAALFPSSAPLLDGDPQFFPLSSPAGIASVAALLFSVAAGALIVKRFGWRALGPAVAAMIAISLQPLLHSENWAFDFRKDVVAKPFFSFSRDEGNVLVVLIDTFQSDVFAEILEDEPALRTQLQGFTYFYNTLATAPYTLFSMPPIYSGTQYREGSIKEFYETAIESSIFTDFKAADYKTALGGYFERGCPTAHCYRTSKLIKASTTAASASPLRKGFLAYLGVIEYASLRLAPTMLHDWIYHDSKGRLRSVFQEASVAAHPYSTTWPGESVVAFDSLRRNFTVDSNAPTFKFFHILTAHAPIVLDAHCRLLADKRKNTRSNYKDQARCAVRRFTDLLEALRGAGLYDDMTIVLMADHGATIRGKPPARKILDTVIPYSGSPGRLNPLFAIKPSQAKGPLALSSAPLQISDLRATLCAIAVRCAGQIPGVNAFAKDHDAARNRRFIDLGPSGLRYAIEHDELPERLFVEYMLTGSSDELKKKYDHTRWQAAEKGAEKS